MNYLAHFHLCHDKPHTVVGSLLGDFVKGNDYLTYHDDVARAILLHRNIDSFTDSHPVFSLSKQRLKKVFRRFGGIIIDLYYDHFLAKHWGQFHNIALQPFSQSIYKHLENTAVPKTIRCQQTIEHMSANDWLCSYRQVDSISRALRGISHRLSRPNPLQSAIICLEDNYSDFEQDFLNFYPLLSDYTEKQKLTIRSVDLRQ